jgi:CxxC-x17-CxxC domain-containing protein
MGNFQGGGRSGGGFRGGASGGRGGFQKKSWGDKGGSGGQAEMFKATCSNCGQSCEVPFRPSGDKPVYCNNCFGKMREGGDRAPRKDFGDRAPRREFNDRSARPSFTPKPAFDSKPSTGGMEKQLAEMNSKLDRLIRTLEVMSLNKPAVKEVKEAPVKASTLKSVVKKAVKKVPAKKKK